MLKYESNTDFNPALKLSITETDNGRKTYFTYTGFTSLDQAEQFAKWWTDKWYWGYEGIAFTRLQPDNTTAVFAERYNSCD